jgi:hypothetical protein
MTKPTLRPNGSLHDRDWEAMVKIIKAYYLADFSKGGGLTKSVGNFFVSIGGR